MRMPENINVSIESSGKLTARAEEDASKRRTWQKIRVIVVSEKTMSMSPPPDQRFPQKSLKIWSQFTGIDHNILIRSEDHRHKSLLWQWVLSVALVTAWCLLVLSGAQVLEHQIVEWISVAPVLDLQIKVKPVPPPLSSAARLQLSTTAQTLWS